MVSKIFQPSPSHGALRQGEIVTGIFQRIVKPETIDDEEPTIQPIEHPYAIVVTQDCDLDRDFRIRESPKNEDNFSEEQSLRLLPSVLFCQMVVADVVRRRKDDGINTKTWDIVSSNRDERYHFLQAVEKENDAWAEGLPELCVEFRRYFAIPTDEVYSRLEISEFQRRCKLMVPYRDHFGLRFAFYQCRVALPEQFFSLPGGAVSPVFPPVELG